MKNAVSRILGWAAKNERHLGAIAFIFGFGVDLVTFTVLSVSFANLAFLGYLGLAALTVALSHIFPRLTAHTHVAARMVSVVAPLGAQYAIGSLLSGFMIFYTKSADISASWPFLVLLALVFVGNEYFRTYYKYLAFQLALLFFALYAYLIFAIPLALNRLGMPIFFASTGAAVGIYALYLIGISRFRSADIRRALRFALPSTLGVLILIQAAYFTGALPPIPLTMSDAGIAHTLVHRNGNYVTMGEVAPQWYEIWKPRTEHIVVGSPLVAYAAIAAPIKFSARVVHRWEHYDISSHSWVTESYISFAISGGRPGGYRGYSEYTPKKDGQWRVAVETPEGQVIGRIPFTLSFVDTPVPLTEETH